LAGGIVPVGRGAAGVRVGRGVGRVVVRVESRWGGPLDRNALHGLDVGDHVPIGILDLELDRESAAALDVRRSRGDRRVVMAVVADDVDDVDIDCLARGPRGGALEVAVTVGVSGLDGGATGRVRGDSVVPPLLPSLTV